MITTNINNWILFAVLPGVLLFSTTATAKIEVELELDDVDTPTALLIKANDSKCNGTILDCIEVKKGKRPYIIFKLPEACGADDDDPQYKLVSMRITQVDKVWPTPKSPLYDVVVNDFKAHKETGIINFSAGNNQKTDKKLKFKNRNSSEYTVYYEISAKHCKDPTKPEIFLDPAIRNKG